jgi:eukaryotic translation initiation factor 2C
MPGRRRKNSGQKPRSQSRTKEQKPQEQKSLEGQFPSLAISAPVSQKDNPWGTKKPQVEINKTKEDIHVTNDSKKSAEKPSPVSIDSPSLAISTPVSQKATPWGTKKPQVEINKPKEDINVSTDSKKSAETRSPVSIDSSEAVNSSPLSENTSTISRQSILSDEVESKSPDVSVESPLINFNKEVSPLKSNTTRVHNGEFPKKRGYGTLGRPIELVTNHYRLGLNKSFVIYQYDVEFDRVPRMGDTRPTDPLKMLKNKELMRDMFKILMANQLSKYQNKIIFNFSKNLYSMIKLPFDKENTYEIKIDSSEYTVRIKPINQLKIDPKVKDDPQTIQLLDLILTQTFNYSCDIVVNRNFFSKNHEALRLGFGLELWRGAYASVRPSECGLTWNIDSANTAFMTCVDLLELACEHYGTDPVGLKKAINSDNRNKEEIGESFMREYRGRKIKTKTNFRKKINAFGPDASHTFSITDPVTKTTSKISIKDYLFKQYKIALKYPQLPTVEIGKESYMPMELCRTEISQKKNLNERETATIIRHTAVPATDRINYIDKWVNNSSIGKDPILNEYNVDLKLKMVEMTGRVLDAPDIVYNKTGILSRTIGSKGCWDHKNLPFANPVGVPRWVIINMSRASENDCLNLQDELIRIGKIHGMQVAQCLTYTETKQRPMDRDVNNTLSDVIKRFNTQKEKLTLIVCILPGTTTGYKCIKTMGDLKHGIATQSIDEKTVKKLNPLTTSNILLKINTKLNGRNFMLSQGNNMFTQYLRNIFGNQTNGNLMIFGADVTHPSINNPNDTTTASESIAAVTGSLDKECCYYAARLYAQKTPNGNAYEMIHDLDKMFIDLLKVHHQKNGSFPTRIVFFRDGVSEGQFSLVLRHEMNRIRTACQNINPGYKPAITFVIVQKRHHTRFIPKNPREYHGKAKNVPPGTVVDNTIVSESMFDYFLCSHSGIQGTSRPCRYFVLHDDNQFTTNQMQLLSHYLCHIYSRCPRSVSYPAPAYYSHLAAFRGRSYIRSVPTDINRNNIISYEIPLHDDIKNKMFYN